MQLKERLRICLLAAASRYPESRIDINEALLGQQPFWQEGYPPLQALEVLQVHAPQLLEAPACLRVDGQASAIYLVEQSEHGCAFWVSREGRGVSKATLSRRDKGARGVEQEGTFQETLHTLRLIWQDKMAFAIYGKQGTLTKKEVFKEVFGKEARKGATRVIDGQEQRTPGYYDHYPFLSRREINGILKAHIQHLATARVVIHVGALLEGDLRRTHMQARNSACRKKEEIMSQTRTKDQRIKQAKQEAKLMLKIEQAKQGMQKAERKVQKAQGRLEDSFTRLRTLEEELTNLRRQGPGHNEQEAGQGHPLHDTEGLPAEPMAHPS